MIVLLTGATGFDGYALLARVGVTGTLTPLMLYGAAVFDMALRDRHPGAAPAALALAVQIALIGFYTVVISWRLPEFRLRPYGPLLKNLPMLAAIWLLHEFEER